jgi:tight adherence protein C
VLALLLLGFVLCGIAVVLVAETVLRGHTARRASLSRVARYATVKEQPRVPVEDGVSVLELIVPALSRVALRVMPRAEPEKLQRRLEAAGWTPRFNAQRFLALKTVLAVLAVLVGFALDGLTGKGFLLVVTLLACALLLPEYILTRSASARADALAADLPQAIDLIVVSLEAGLGFDAALSYFVQRSPSPFARELRIVLSEIRMGESRAEALKRLAERVPHPDVRSFVHTLVQSEGVGISRVPLLKSQAEDLRMRHQLAAEEKAQRAPVKMLFPTVIFILPVMFVVLLGPAFQQAGRLFHQ